MRTAGKIGIALAAAFGLAYGSYAIGTNSADCPDCKPLEETVCEEVDTQGIFNQGRREGYLAGLRHGIDEGRTTGERETKDKWFESGRIYGYNLGLEECNNARYLAGLEEGKQEGYEEGIIEGEQLGLEEGRRRFLGSGTTVMSGQDGYYFATTRQNNEDEFITLNIEMDEQKCISRYIIVNSRANPALLEDVCTNNKDADGLVDNIEQRRQRSNSSVYDRVLLQRDRDFYANQDLFLWADQKMKEETERYSQPVNIRL